MKEASANLYRCRLCLLKVGRNSAFVQSDVILVDLVKLPCHNCVSIVRHKAKAAYKKQNFVVNAPFGAANWREQTFFRLCCSLFGHILEVCKFKKSSRVVQRD